MTRAERALTHAKRFTSLFEADVADAKKGKVTDITEEQSLAFRLNIQSAVVSGALSVEAAETLISTMNANGQDYTQALTLRLSTQTPQEVDRLGRLMTFVNEKNKARLEIETRGLSAADLDEFNTGLEEFTKLPPDIGIKVDLEVNDKKDIADIRKFGKEVEALKAQFPDGKVTRTTLELYQTSIGGPGVNTTLDAGIKDFKMVEKYAPELRLQAMLTLQTLTLSDSFKAELDTEMKNEFKRLNPSLPIDSSAFETGFATWKATEEAKAFKLKVEPEMKVEKLDDLLAAYQKQIDIERAAAIEAAKPKRDKSWIEDLLLRLKLLKESTINAKNGLKELEKYLGKNSKNTTNLGFDKEGRGLLNQIETRAKNNKVTTKGGKKVAAPITLSQDLMDFISGLDVDQLNFFIKDYLKTDKSGNVIGFKPGFEIINTAFKVEGIAVFLRNVKDENTELERQEALFNKLINPTGQYKWNVEQAAWAMQDAALAGALMRKEQLSPEELKAYNDEYARRVKILAKGKSTDMTQDISKTENQIKTLTILTKAGVNFNDALDISKVKEFSDEIALAYGATDTTGQLTVERAKEIRDKFKGYIQDVKDLRNAIFNLEQQSETRSDKRTDEFAAEAARISVTAQAAFRKANGMSVDQFGVVTREKEVLQQTYQDQIDDYNDGLSAIDKLEESVNEKYDAKIKLVDKQAEALDEVLSLNEDIAAQQQNQLTLADALTQGDISAAAKAAEEYSAQQAAVASRSAGEALDKQKSAMEIAKQKELDNLTTKINGKDYTRKQLADAITKVQEDQIKPLEKEIEARNRLVAAYELALDKATKTFEIQGMTSEEWGNIKDAVGLLNDAYDAQVVDIDKIATSVGGVSGAWVDVTKAIKDASLELGKYPGFKQESDADVKARKDAEAKALADAAAAKAAAANAGAGAGSGAGAGAGAGAQTVDPNSARGRLNAYLKAKADREAAAKKLAEEKALAAAKLRKEKIESYRANNFWAYSMSDEVIATKLGLANGGFVPKYFGAGGFANGTDTVPAMLTPGEFVVKKNVADQYGAFLQSLNNGTYKTFEAPTFSSMNNDSISVGSGSGTSSADNSSKVYNYNVGISVSNTNASADDIAKVVMAEIKYIDSQRLRGQR